MNAENSGIVTSIFRRSELRQRPLAGASDPPPLVAENYGYRIRRNGRTTWS